MFLDVESRLRQDNQLVVVDDSTRVHATLNCLDVDSAIPAIELDTAA